MKKENGVAYRHKIQVLRSDNREEYKSDPYLQLCRDEGIGTHFTIRETYNKMGVAERLNNIVLEKLRCLLSNNGLKKHFRVRP